MSDATTAQPSLRELQLWMRWVLTDPRGVTGALAGPAPDRTAFPERYRAPEKCALAWIREEPPTARLEIYSEGYFARLVQALEGDFPHVRAVLQQDLFTKLVADYLKAYPSRTPDINEVGASLSKFCATYEGMRELGFLSDLARSDRLARESFLAAAEPTLDPVRLTQIPPEAWPQTTFTIHPRVRHLRSAWDLTRLWSGDIPDAPGAGATYQIDRGEIQTLPAFEARTLAGMETGLRLQELLATEDAGTTPEQVMTAFARWLRNGTILSISY